MCHRITSCSRRFSRMMCRWVGSTRERPDTPLILCGLVDAPPFAMIDVCLSDSTTSGPRGTSRYCAR
jgi:hypothetical protein